MTIRPAPISIGAFVFLGALGVSDFGDISDFGDNRATTMDNGLSTMDFFGYQLWYFMVASLRRNPFICWSYGELREYPLLLIFTKLKSHQTVSPQ